MVLQYLAEPILEIDGQPAPLELMEDLLQIVVEESLHLPGMFTFVISNAYYPGRTEHDQPWTFGDSVSLGKKIKIGFKSSTTDSPEFSDQEQDYVFEGEITGIETHFSGDSQAPVTVRGYDISHRLHRGRHNRTFVNMTDSDIVKQIIGEIGIPPGTIQPSGEPHEHIYQQNQTNMEFLRERAARLGYELFVQGGKLQFRKPQKGEALELKWFEDIHSFHIRISSAEQVSGVEVRGWDYTSKRAIVETINNAQLQTSNSVGLGSTIAGKFQVQPKAIVVGQPIFSANQAKAMAQSLCDELGGEYITADVRGEGNPKLRVGKLIKLTGMDTYSGDYYITETRHIFKSRTYHTELAIRGTRGGSLYQSLAQSRTNTPGLGFLVGIVTDNKDPKSWGRVKVKFPTLTEDHASYWARVVSAGAGLGRGFDCLPEVNDEVLVAFEHGDINRPYVLGGVWNGTDAPPEPVADSVMGGKVRLRTIKTRVGHKMQLVEEDKGGSKCGVYIETTGGHKIHLNDSDQFIEVKTTGGHTLRLDDRGKQIEVKTSGGHQMKMDDMAQSVTVSSTMNMTIKATANMDIEAGAILTIKGSLIKIN